METEYTVLQYNNPMSIPEIQQLRYKFCGNLVTAAVLNNSMALPIPTIKQVWFKTLLKQLEILSFDPLVTPS